MIFHLSIFSYLVLVDSQVILENYKEFAFDICEIKMEEVNRRGKEY